MLPLCKFILKIPDVGQEIQVEVKQALLFGTRHILVPDDTHAATQRMSSMDVNCFHFFLSYKTPADKDRGGSMKRTTPNPLFH